MAWINKGWLLLLFCGVVSSAEGQTWNELFRQKKTQRRYLAEQIAALKLYSGYLQQGYEVASDGLSLVRDLSGGEFSLHKDYFTSLGQVSPLIRNNWRIAQILSLQAGIVRGLNSITDSPHLFASDKAYIGLLQENLIGGTATDLTWLLLLVTSGKLELTEQQRLQQLKILFKRMQEKAAIVRQVRQHVGLLARKRSEALLENQTLERFYKLNP